jgi:hypothetical protein
LPRPWGDHSRQPFRKDPAGALRVRTDKLADADLSSDTGHAPGQIGARARVMAVDTRGEDGADRTGHGLMGRGHVQGHQRCGVVRMPRVKLK